MESDSWRVDKHNWCKMISLRRISDGCYLLFLFLMLLQDFIPIFDGLLKSFSNLGLFVCLCIFLNRNHWRINQKYYLLWILYVLLYFYLSTVWAIRPILSYWVIVQVVSILIMTFSMLMYTINRNKIYHLLAVYYVAAIFMLIYVVLKLDLSALEGQRVTDAMDVDTETWNSNSIGLTLATAIYCGFLLKQRCNRGYKLCFYLITIAMLYVIMLTGSRKSLILLFIPIFYFCVCNFKKHFFKVLIGGCVACLFVYILIMEVPLFYEIIGKRMEDLFNILTNNTDGTEDISRVMLIWYGWNWFLEHPVFGVGVNNFRALSNLVPLFAGKNFYAHNNYIEMLVGCGLVGFILYYSAHFYLLKHTLRLHSVAARWVVSYILVTMFVDVAMVSYYDLMTHYFLVICFIVIYQEKCKTHYVEK